MVRRVPMRMEFRPIDTWPWPHTDRREDSPFSAGHQATRDLLERELRMLDTAVGRICMALSDAGIRQDRTGPLASASPDHPGVIVVAELTSGETLRFGTDRYRGWQANLRAVSLGMESLRRVDRYGITRSGEQYRGFMALPAGDGETSEAEAWSVIERMSGMSAPRDHPDRAVRCAMAAAHPDRDGDPDLFDAVVRAAKVLGLR